MAFNLYDPASVAITFKGKLLTGFADGSFISATQAENQFDLQVGSDGESCRNRSNNRSGTITVTLIHTSASNEVLRALHQEDLLARTVDGGAPEGAGVGSFQVKDLNGTTLLTAENAWISKFPSVDFDRESTSREWEFMTDNLAFEGL